MLKNKKKSYGNINKMLMNKFSNIYIICIVKTLKIIVKNKFNRVCVCLCVWWWYDIHVCNLCLHMCIDVL